MFFKLSKKSKIHKILVISLSNIGDVVLTCPVIDSLIQYFPNAEVSIVVGPKASSLFDQNPYVQDIIIFDKHQSWGAAAKWMMQLRRNYFDLVIDLRRTAIPLFLSSKFCTPVMYNLNQGTHMKEKHLSYLKCVIPDVQTSKQRYAIFLDHNRCEKMKGFLNQHLNFFKTYYIVAPGSANPAKRWTSQGFAQTIHFLSSQIESTVLFVGDQNDFEIAQDIMHSLSVPMMNLCGKLHLLDVACLLRQSQFVLGVDSAISHLASYFDIPVLTLFGLSDPAKYRPWGQKGFFLRGHVSSENEQTFLDGINPNNVAHTVLTKMFDHAEKKKRI